MHSKNWLTKPLSVVPTSLAIVLLVVALLGFVDATYLTIEHYSGVIPPCSVVEGCEQVLTSEYATILGVPVALGGSIFYLSILIGLCAYLESRNEKFLRITLLLTAIGFLSSSYFLYIQAFVLGAFCLYCLGSATTSTILFGLAIYVFSKYSKAREVRF
jgi:uncharacterized membrane protein